MRYLLAILLFYSTHAMGSEIKSSAEDEIQAQFPGTPRIYFEKFNIPPQKQLAIEKACRQKFYRNKVYIWDIHTADGKRAVAILDNVYGKAQPITFLTIFEEDGTIRSVRIIKYRETIGGAVSNRKWLQQFKGWQLASQEKLKDKIDGLSGATISANAIIRGVNKLAMLLPAIKEHIEKNPKNTQVTE